MSLNPGEIIKDRYRIIKQLGKGGFGAVYRAEDLSLKAQCALKENLDDWAEAQNQFEREALILAGLRHPNLPRVTDYFNLPGQGQYLVMDFVEGFDLETILERIKQPLAEVKVLEWCDQICDALIYLHSQKPPIIHRDIKPANIKITPPGQAMLVDFGIAKAYEIDTKTTLGARAVTPGYSPIEQYGDGSTDERTDLYSMGATVYTLLTTQQPPESVSRVTGEQLVSPRNLNPRVSPHVERSILKAMGVLASERYENVAEFRKALKTPPVESAESEKKASQSRSEPRMLPPRVAQGLQSNSTDAPASAIQDPTTRSLSLSTKSAVKMEWITIPEGEFLYGGERRTKYVPGFEISKYPVTNQQYKVFLNANPKHPVPEHWRNGVFPMRKMRHPVVGINLHDALAFCKWLGYRLPREEEWEKAARGDNGLTYPWGEQWKDGKYCNNWDAGIDDTTPVDKYSAGVSPYGVWDMVGNVWEWTSSDYQGPHMHVLRGGSWQVFGQDNVRATARAWLVLGDSRKDLGFRCARSV